MTKIKSFFKEHWLAIVLAVAVGLIYVWPYFFFIYSLGDDYKGIPMLNTANEDFYLARIQEIVDGYWSVSSQAFYEYKDQKPLQPPTTEFIYALPSLIFDTSPAKTFVASRFFLPAILFILVYFLVRAMTQEKQTFSNKMNALTGALLVSLGPDLIDYRSLWNFFNGQSEYLASGFLIWARPVNPITGAIFLFSFLLFVWAIIQKTEWKKSSIFGAAVFLALMFASYFFSWGIAVSVLFVLILIYTLKKDYALAGRLAIIFPLAFLFSLPYWFNAWQASHNLWYKESVLRSGLFLTHYPLLNKFVLAGIIGYLVVVFFWGRKNLYEIQHSNFLSVSFFLGTLLAYNQQIITGRTIWPYHFAQYSVSLVMIVFIVVLYNVIKHKSEFLWGLSVLTIASVSLFYGIFVQVGAYQIGFSRAAESQRYAPLFEWLNSQENNCVVLAKNKSNFTHDLNGLIPAFTHCNVYNSNWSYSLMPEKRIYHNYMTHIMMMGVAAENVANYLKTNPLEARIYLFENWKELYGRKEFPDFDRGSLKEKIKKIPHDYRGFLENAKEEISKYRLDYILVEGELSGKMAEIVSELPLEYQLDDILVYSFRRPE